MAKLSPMSRHLVVLLASSAIGAPVMAQAVADAGEQAGEIIVTASKRDERLVDVPAAVTALSSDTISRLGIQNFRDYATLVPGLSQRDFGQPGTGVIILRGLNTGPQQTNATAAFYIDETLFTPSGFVSTGSLLTPDPDLGDVDRIEVLKGPQGTLYGANNLGGVIRIVTKKPDASGYDGNVRGELTTVDGGGTGWSLRGAVNVPIIADKLAVRASGFYRDAPGFVDNVGTGTRNVNTTESYGGRLAVRATPTEELTIDLTGVFQDINNVGYSVQDGVSGTLTPLFGKRQYSQFGDLPSRLQYRIGSGIVDYDFGPVSLVTTVSYGEFRSAIQNDFTAILLPLFGFLPPNTKLLSEIGPNTKKWTAETRLVSERLGAFEFVAGLFYTSENSTYKTSVVSLDGNTLQQIPGPFGVVVRGASLSDYEEYAGFANVTFYLSESLDVTGGIRYSRYDETATVGAPVDGQGAISFFRPRSPESFTNSDDPVNWLATVRWRPTSEISAYLRAASGYRPGGPQLNASPPPGAQTQIRPDTVWNYEAGIKGNVLDGTLSFDLALYHIDWSDIQLNSLSGGTVLQGNGASAKVDGLEANVQARPLPWLTIGGSFAWTNARLSEVSPGTTAVLGAASGDQLPLTPEYMMAMVADAVFPLSDDMQASFGGTFRFQSDMPSGFPGDALNPNIKVPSFETVDLRAGLVFGRYTVQARADNIFDALGVTSAVTNRVFPGQQVPTLLSLSRPRSFTLSFGVDF